IILNKELWVRSGHWDHYRENMYFTEIDGKEYAVKPMNCPGGMLVYKSSLHSYRELPIRMAEIGLVHRHELSGVLHGLMRVRAFNQDDAHIYMTPDQIKDEIKGVITLADKIYSVFGFDYHIELSTKPENAMGSDEVWERATTALREALEELGKEYRINEGDGAFYGPKIDFHLKDSIGRTWQCGTIQLDFMMPERFDLTYINEKGEKVRPVMLHRTIYGSIERFMGILIEHYAGVFPVWLAPEQIRILSVTTRNNEYAQKIFFMLSEEGFRVNAKLENEKIGAKIRDAELARVPYMIIIGDREEEKSLISVRKKGEGDLGAFRLEEFIERVKKEIKEYK
ncbi:MAG TPA: threonine--tRNA ligase, partial [Candidatus Atribacteria bacterium]|nr:threonine--tRNA ligase [Candidatus Atribacteria bacterium]